MRSKDLLMIGLRAPCELDVFEICERHFDGWEENTVCCASFDEMRVVC